MSSPYPYGQYPPPPNPYYQGGGYPYGPQGYYQPNPPPQVMYAPPAYRYQNDNACCWACLAGMCLCCALDELC